MSGKPRKVGILLVLSTKKKVAPVRRFSILTSDKVIDMFSQEVDYQDHKADEVPELDTCQVEILEDTESDFRVITSKRTFNLRAIDDQDRRNWVLEILKQRSVPEVIAMLEDPKLGSYAAYALANICGGEPHLKIEIVQHQGHEKLLQFSNSDDMRLVGLIYYAFSKLSTMEENKEALGLHLEPIVKLLDQSNGEFRMFALQTMTNVATLASNQSRIRELGGIPKVAATMTDGDRKREQQACLCFTALMTDNPANQEACLSFMSAMTAVFQGWAADTSRRSRSQMPPLVDAISMLQTLSAQESFFEPGPNSPLPSLLQLLEVRFPNVLQPLTDLIIEFSKRLNPEFRRAFVEHANYLAKPLAVDDAQVVANTVSYLNNLPSDTEFEPMWNLVGLEKVAQVLCHEDEGPRTLAAQVFRKRCASAAARQALGQSPEHVNAVLLAVTHGLEADARNEYALDVLAGMAELVHAEAVRLRMCTTPLLAKLQHMMADVSRKATHTPIMNVLLTCSKSGAAKHALGNEATVLALTSYLGAKDVSVNTRVALILANLALVAANRRTFARLGTLQHVVGLLVADKDRKMRIAALRALANFCYLDAIEADFVASEGLAEVVKLLTSKSGKLRVAAVECLRNCSLSPDAAKRLAALNAVSMACASLQASSSFSPRSSQKQHVMVIVRNCLLVPGVCAQAEDVSFILGLIATDGWDERVLETALSALHACLAQQEEALCQLVVTQGLTPLLACLTSTNFLVRETAAHSLAECAAVPACQGALAKHLKLMWSLVAVRHPVFVQHVLTIVHRCCSAPALAADAAVMCPNDPCWKALLYMLQLPNAGLQAAAARCVSARFTGADGCVTVPAEQAMTALAALVAQHRRNGGVQANAQGGLQLRLDGSALSLAAVSADPLLRVTAVDGSDAGNQVVVQGLVLARCLWDANKAPPGLDVDGLVASTAAWAAPLSVDAASSSSSSSSPLSSWKALGLSHVQLRAVVHYRAAHDALAGRHSTALRDFVRQADGKHLMGLYEEETQAQAPTLDPDSASPLLTLGEDLLSARYARLFVDRAASVRTSAALSHDVHYTYYEVLVVNAGLEGTISVGLVHPDAFDAAAHPGWVERSYGWHGDDGNAFGHGENKAYGPAFGTGDVVGCGFDNVTGQVFFTKNGRWLGVAYDNVPAGLVPTVGLNGPGEHVMLNFGQQPFLWNYECDDASWFEALPQAKAGSIVPPPASSSEQGTVVWDRVFRHFSHEWSFLEPSYHTAADQLTPHVQTLIGEPPEPRFIATKPVKSESKAGGKKRTRRGKKG